MHDAEQPAGPLPGDPFLQSLPQPQALRRSPRQHGQQQHHHRHQHHQQQQQPHGRQPFQPDGRRRGQQPPQPADGGFAEWATSSGLSQALVSLAHQVLEEAGPDMQLGNPEQLRLSFWQAHRQRITATGDPSDAEAMVWLRQHYNVPSVSYGEDSDEEPDPSEVAAVPTQPRYGLRPSGSQQPQQITVLRRSSRSHKPPADLTLCSPAAFGQLTQPQPGNAGVGMATQPPASPVPVPQQERHPSRPRPVGRSRR